MKNSHSENNVGKRIGFILATIHTGSSLNLWLSLAAKASESRKSSFFVFPGGKLDAGSGPGSLRNRIYSLANSTNLDGLISWSSSIGGSVSISELNEFHKKFDGIPYVTIGHKIGGNPFVEFDAYSGMKSLVEHFIKVHGAKRIAFVRGPENHSSAEDRYRAYKDAMRENNLATPENENLVSSCCSWYEAEAAAVELYEKRGLVPGKDFDALVASSDLMAKQVVDYFVKRGFRVPKDFIVGGFNDTIEGRAYNPRFSTVHMPQSELGIEAFRMIRKILDGEQEVSDEFMTAYPVIRESCGCNNFKSLIAPADSKGKMKTRQQIKEEFCRVMRRGVDSDFARDKIEPMLEALFSNSKSEFFSHAGKLIEECFVRDGELSDIFTAIAAIRNSNSLSEEYIDKILRTLYVLVPQIQGRVYANRRSYTNQVSTVLSALKSDLLSVHIRKDLVRVLKAHLPKIGIKTLSIVLHTDGGDSQYFGGFNIVDSEIDDGIRTDPIPFDGDRLLPEEYAADTARGVFVVQPLFMENRSYGYIVANYSGCDGIVYEDLRSSVSNALQSIFLFEEIEAAKMVAEQAEFEKTEFFASVGSELCDPLKVLSSKVTQMETNVNDGLVDAEILSEQLLFLKSQIEAQLEKTETLVDLTRTQVDELPMDKKLFNVRQILPVNISASLDTEVPMLFGDVDRLKRAVDTIFESNGKNPVVSFDIDGFHISFDSSKVDWQKTDVLLAEKIILLQYGEIVKSDKTSEIIIPWPNLSGMPPMKFHESEITLFSLSGSEIEIFGHRAKPFSMKEFEESGMNADSIAFCWNPDESTIDEIVKVYSLRRNERLFRVPVICFSQKLIGHSFMEMLEQEVKAQKASAVLFVGCVHARYGTWATDSNSVSISSMDEFDDILNEITPSLIVFEHIEEKDIVRIRKNHKTVLVPIIVLPDEVVSEQYVESLCSHPRIILCNRGAAESEQFNERIHNILSGEEILPPHTGALVKKAILYLNKNASQQIVRWKLADTVHVSEDYLTRIFHKEIGLSLWEYLNRYRIYIATKMLLETNDTIYEIAENSGFQDQAYFCRVFKKIYGIPPGKIRTKN